MSQKLTRERVQALFLLAGITVKKIRALPDGYSYDPDDDRYFSTPPYQVWWFVKTAVGWIEIGWRKRVININWEDLPVRTIVTDDNVTKNFEMVHAYSEEKAIEYLAALSREITKKVEP
jgi:hypothetical protein